MGDRFVAFLIAASAAIVGGCASSQPVSERLDPDTATTVTVMDHPVELVADSALPGGSDPFAFIAPFETDRMGERTLFLWVSTPESMGAKVQPQQLLCNGQPVGLQPLEGPLQQLALSRAPYASPTPWSAQWYFRLAEDGLKCLATAQAISLETRASEGQAARFTADRKNLASLEAFTTRR